jgi:hypothetical protein
MSAWKEDPLHLGGTAVVALRETGTKNIVGYMTWDEVVKTMGGIPELFGLMGVINLPNGTKVYAEPGFATIPLNKVDTQTLQTVITKLDTPTLQKAIIKLDETTIQKIDTKTLLFAIPKLDLGTLQAIVPKLDNATVQKMALSQTLDASQIQDVVQSLTTTQTQDLVQSLSLVQLEIVAPLLTTVQVTELTKRLPPVKRDSLLRILKKEVKPSAEEDKFVVTFTDYGGRVEVLNVKAQTFKEAYWRAFSIRRWHGRPHSVDLIRNL